MCLSCEPPIADEILGYLAVHPDAQDTLEGIVEWWLLEQKINVQTNRVRETLEGLVAEGLIVERLDTESRSLYRLNRRRRATILKMIKQRKGGGEAGG
ncbi:MAG TPA: hypothetical protein VHU19_11080 [Pyrinomonadaceae bacterium]|jgi:hypothetical protein|nr:hypothetical protein [Pyrinomonadaceae bacterium]